MYCLHFRAGCSPSFSTLILCLPFTQCWSGLSFWLHTSWAARGWLGYWPLVSTPSISKTYIKMSYSSWSQTYKKEKACYFNKYIKSIHVHIHVYDASFIITLYLLSSTYESFPHGYFSRNLLFIDDCCMQGFFYLLLVALNTIWQISKMQFFQVNL